MLFRSELQGQRRFGLLRAGLAVSYSLSVEANQPSSRLQVFPEAGIYGGPSLLRLGLFLGIGPLFIREPLVVDDAGGFQVLLAFRPRVSVAVALTPELDLQLGCGFTLALDAGNLPRHFLYGSLGVGYGF